MEHGFQVVSFCAPAAGIHPGKVSAEPADHSQAVPSRLADEGFDHPADMISQAINSFSIDGNNACCPRASP